MKKLYETYAEVKHGGREGTVKVEETALELKLSLPKSLGGTGNGSNPEQLFAAGYSACFANAALHVAKMGKLDLEDVPVRADVTLNATETGAFALGVVLNATVDLPQEQAKELIAKADQVCPYSNGLRGGNAKVKILVNGEAI